MQGLTFLLLDHPLSGLEGEEGRSVEDDVDDGLEGVR